MSCQLCFSHPGTVAHRFQCTVNRPAKGFPPPPKQANLALQRVGTDRDDAFKLRGILTVQIPLLPHREQGTFKWVRNPITTERDLDNATWYTDGSMAGGIWRQLRTTGFGLVVVSEQGELLGYGSGSPPSRVSTAACAELWAILVALSMRPALPRIKTDCLSILTSARAGNAAVTGHHKMLARIWNSITAIVGDDVSSMVESGLWQWVPAPLSIQAVGQATAHNRNR